MTKFLLLMFAGGLGAVARWGLSELVQTAWGNAFPWATWIVNALGCFLFGLIWTLAHEKQLLTAEQSFVLLTGFMGAFTTFSTFAFETHVMLKHSQWLLTVAYLVAQNLSGLLAVMLGCTCAKVY